MTTRGLLTMLLAAASLTAATAEEQEPAQDDEPPITAEEILANPLSEEAYEQSSRCLSTGKYRRVEIMNHQILVFHGRGDEKWLNILPNRCMGLQPDMILRIEKRGMRLCARDQFRGVPRFRPEAPSMPCTLGEFHPTRPENVTAIRDAIEAGQQTTTVDRTVRSAGRETEGGDKPESNGNGQRLAP
ncbi:MAG: hypothetical protein OXL38_06995 [Gammaproteobacteria bacterium]|nr:hypothetical protein [Gammaproteobacteria bacterium]